jgi:hypothetical protein
MSTKTRITMFAVMLLLVALAGANGAGVPTCIYECRNTTTGQETIRSESVLSEAACCGGQGQPCLAGTVWEAAIAWNGKFCAGL